MTEVCETVDTLRAALAKVRASGQTVALVPTMGALHEGHVALVEEAHRHADVVVVSIFVNPTQFGPHEDFDRYPRDRDHDVALLAAFEPVIVFAPTVPEMGRQWEGAERPGHFDGVLTVVNRFFDIVKPDVAVFGEKDWQQLTLIRGMARERHPEILIVGVPTIRDAHGVALSGRNR